MIRALLPGVAAAVLAGCAPSQGEGGGIVSTNPCADAMLVRLVAPGRIAAISHLSQDAGATSIPLPLARRFRVTAGTAEEVVALRPDLVLASSFTAPATRDAFQRAGLRTIYLDSPATIAASVAQVRQVAAAVGEPERGELLASEIARAATAHAVPGPKPSALLFIAGDLANGGGTLLDEMMRRTGFRNAAADYGLRFTGTLPAEWVVARPPAVVIAAGEGRGAMLRRRLLRATPVAHLNRSLVNCGGPVIVSAMARLRAIRATLS